MESQCACGAPFELDKLAFQFSCGHRLCHCCSQNPSLSVLCSRCSQHQSSAPTSNPIPSHAIPIILHHNAYAAVLALEKDKALRQNSELQTQLESMTAHRDQLWLELVQHSHPPNLKREIRRSNCTDNTTSNQPSQRLEEENAKLKLQFEAANSALKEQNDRYQAQIADIKAKSSATICELKANLKVAIRSEQDVKSLLEAKTQEQLQSLEQAERLRAELIRTEGKRVYLEEVVRKYKAYAHQIKMRCKGKDRTPRPNSSPRRGKT
ncbi:hypothetical protein D9758_000039 [Tetrapyrgos nigripes]|uniref:RING-type domain-containing protein n=1 Tax=Tetrapyrgos nigripes TaxID=182062 RepID=A0A8H5LZA5_9AGAR|nr:hypothetical protein D9758_000039 [Tetrapyrgos nigripes]